MVERYGEICKNDRRERRPEKDGEGCRRSHKGGGHGRCTHLAVTIVVHTREGSIDGGVISFETEETVEGGGEVGEG